MTKDKKKNKKKSQKKQKKGPCRRGSNIRNTAEAEILRVIEYLDSCLLDKADDIHRKIREMMEMVRNDLRLILDFVADKKLEEGSRLKYWISDVVEIAQDGRSLIIDKRNLPNYFYLSALFKPICRALMETRECILQLGVEEANTSPITYLSPPEQEDENVVGFVEDVESALPKLNLREVRSLSALCIVGMAGVGKTTLAREVYNHATVVDCYKLRAWVSLSGEPSSREVLMKLVRELLRNEDQSHVLLEERDNQSLQRMLHQHLQGKRFLIVLDNIGKVPYFESIFKALPREDEKSRLLLTSRFQSIKERVEDYICISCLEMKPLDDNRSWQVFLKLLLYGNQRFPKQLERKGREMLRRCDGLLLSIKEVATQFIIKRQNGGEWEDLLESLDLSVTLAVLESIYQRWPPKLKSCFLCLSFFKKDTTIRRDKLLQIWTAGQIIPHEDEVESYFGVFEFSSDFLQGYYTTLKKLTDEFVIEVERNNKQRKNCIRINASFHTLSMTKAEEQMIFETLQKRDGSPPSSQEPRHRALYCSRDEFNQFTGRDERLVSLFFRGGGYFNASEPYWKRFAQLRTIDFEGFGLKILPETIGALAELRYLGLRDNYIQELPRSLARLKNLEVLDIALNFMMEVPDILWEIGSLRHLYMSDIICRKPLKIDTLKNLETSTYISVNNWTFEVSSLKMMTSLRELGVEEVDENSDVSKLFASFAYLSDLNSLILRGFHFRNLPSLHGLETLHHLTHIRLDGVISKLPDADIFPPKITHLCLINSCLDEDPMPELGRLNLSYLKLKNAYNGQQMLIPSGRFLNLQVLCVKELWHLRNIVIENYLRMLEILEIKSCSCMENIPNYIVTYQTIEMKMLTTRRLATKIRKSDYISKIHHVDIQP